MTRHTRNIGLIGAGLMGAGIAASLLRHKHPLAILAHPGNQPLDALQAAGATVIQQAADLAAAADVIILCVTGTPQVEQVLFQAGGVLEGIRPGSTIIDCSTAIPSSTLRIAEAVHNAGARFLDAPMTRTPKEAAEGRLNLIVGGDRDVFEDCLPILQSYAETITHAGGTGAGHQMKLLHNFVSLGFSAVLAEAAACARHYQVDPQTLCDVLASGGGNGVVLNRLRPYIETGDASGFRFSVANALKDMQYYTTMAKDRHAQDTVAQSIRTLYDTAVQAGLGQAPIPQLVAHLATVAEPPSA